MPYAWTLLTIYFLQVGFEQEAMLPPFERLRLNAAIESYSFPNMPTNLTGLDDCVHDWAKPAPSSALGGMSLGQLFKRFVSFYLQDIDWKREVVCVRFGQRASNLTMKHHTVTKEDGSSELAATIEDPFARSENVGETLTHDGRDRLKEELERAQECFRRGASLTEILTQWVPAEKATPDQGCSRLPPGLEDMLGSEGVPPRRAKA